MTLRAELSAEIRHALFGKAEAFAAAHLRPNGSAADLPFGDGPVNLGGVAGVAGPKTWIFDVLGPGRPPGALGRSKPYVLRRSAPF